MNRIVTHKKSLIILFKLFSYEFHQNIDTAIFGGYCLVSVVLSKEDLFQIASGIVILMLSLSHVKEDFKHCSTLIFWSTMRPILKCYLLFFFNDETLVSYCKCPVTKPNEVSASSSWFLLRDLILMPLYQQIHLSSNKLVSMYTNWCFSKNLQTVALENNFDKSILIRPTMGLPF